MRRVVHHAAIGLGCSALVVTAAVAGLGSPVVSGTALAVPGPATTRAEPLQSASESSASVDRGSDRDTAARGAAAREQATVAAVTQALERHAALTSTSRSISRQQAKIVAQQKAAATAKKIRTAEVRAAAAKDRAARAKAAAAREKAEAARARAAAAAAREEASARAAEEAAARAAEEAQQARVRAQGYVPGTTDPREIARQILQNKFGYGVEQFDCFNNIIIRESGWVIDATNPSSGAYGIPQALPGSKMATVADDWRTNPATQIIWAVGYMKDRYGSPCSAWSFKSANGWY